MFNSDTLIFEPIIRFLWSIYYVNDVCEMGSFSYT